MMVSEMLIAYLHWFAQRFCSSLSLLSHCLASAAANACLNTGVITDLAWDWCESHYGRIMLLVLVSWLDGFLRNIAKPRQ